MNHRLKNWKVRRLPDEMKERAYGGLEIQIGYCNGNNKKLNAVEYHRSSELDIAVDDLILLLGCCTSERYEYRTDEVQKKTIEGSQKSRRKDAGRWITYRKE